MKRKPIVEPDTDECAVYSEGDAHACRTHWKQWTGAGSCPDAPTDQEDTA